MGCWNTGRQGKARANQRREEEPRMPRFINCIEEIQVGLGGCEAVWHWGSGIQPVVEVVTGASCARAMHSIRENKFTGYRGESPLSSFDSTWPGHLTGFLLRRAARATGGVGLALLVGQDVVLQPWSESYRPPCPPPVRRATRRIPVRFLGERPPGCTSGWLLPALRDEARRRVWISPWEVSCRPADPVTREDSEGVCGLL